jgi:hypothetical protein
MRVALRPAIPVALPRSTAGRAGRDRLLRWVANAVTVLVATVAIVVVAMAAVVMGIT